MANNSNGKVVQNKITKPARLSASDIITRNCEALVRNVFRLYTIIETDEQQDSLTQNSGDHSYNLDSQASSPTSTSLPSTDTAPKVSGARYFNPFIEFLPTFRRSQRYELSFPGKTVSSLAPFGTTKTLPNPWLSDFYPSMNYKPILRLKRNIPNITTKVEIKLKPLLQPEGVIPPESPGVQLPAMTPTIHLYPPKSTRTLPTILNFKAKIKPKLYKEKTRPRLTTASYRDESTLPTAVEYISLFQLDRIDEECDENLQLPIITEINSQLQPAVDLSHHITTQDESSTIMRDITNGDDYSNIAQVNSPPILTENNQMHQISVIMNIPPMFGSILNSTVCKVYTPQNPHPINPGTLSTSQLKQEEQKFNKIDPKHSEAEVTDEIRDISSTLTLLPNSAVFTCTWYIPPLNPPAKITEVPATSQLEQDNQEHIADFVVGSQAGITDEISDVSSTLRLLPNSAVCTWYTPPRSPPAIITEIPATSQLEQEDQECIETLAVRSEAEVKDIWSKLRWLPNTVVCAWYNPPLNPIPILTIITSTLQFGQKIQVYIANTLVYSQTKGIDILLATTTHKNQEYMVSSPIELLYKQDDQENSVNSLEWAESSRVNSQRTNVSSKLRRMGRGPFSSGNIKVNATHVNQPVKTRHMTVTDIMAKFERPSDYPMYIPVNRPAKYSRKMRLEPVDEKYSVDSLRTNISPKRIIDFTQSMRSERILQNNSVQPQVQCSPPPTPCITNITPSLPKDLFKNREGSIGDSTDVKPQQKNVRKDTLHKLQSSFKTNQIQGKLKPTKKIGPIGKVAFFSSHTEFFERGKKLHRMATQRGIIDAGWEEPRAAPHKYCMNAFYSNQNQNIDIICEGMVFSVHLTVLQTHSKYFQRMKIPEKRYVLLPITANGFKMAYNWIRDPKPDMTFHGIVELYLAAEFLEINNLRDLAWNYMDDIERFNEVTAYFLYKKAKILKCKRVVQLAVNRISKFFLVIVGSKDFLKFEFEEVRLFLKSSHIAVHCELEILFCGIRWINHDWKNRRKHFWDILMCVRYTMMCPIHLVGLTTTFLKHEPKTNLAILMLMDKELQDIITNAYHYVIRRQSDPQISTNMKLRALWLQKYNLVEEQPRCYIQNAKDGGHSYIGNFVTNIYSEFEYIVKKINKAHPCHYTTCSLMKPQK